MAEIRIKQAVAKVVNWDTSYYWIRISRRSLSSLASYYRNKSEFRYLKIYDIINYRKGGKHQISRQTGFVTIHGQKYEPLR